MKVCILAGGKGTRLWPLSQKNAPKQFLNLSGYRNLLIETIERMRSRYSIEDIVIITSESLEIPMARILKAASLEHVHVVVEPATKNTGFAIVHALKTLFQRNLLGQEEPVLMCPSDHIFDDVESFHQTIQYAISNYNPHQFYLFGVKPSYAEKGYGYVQCGQGIDTLHYSVQAFHEKPSEEEAKQYVKNDKMLWNSGIVLLSWKGLHDELKRYHENYYKYFIGRGSYDQLMSFSFDKLLLEKSSNVCIYPLNTKWWDVGSYDALYSIMSKDEDGNALEGSVALTHSRRNLVIAKSQRIALIDVDDLIVAESHDGMCIMKRGSSQKVNLVVERLQKLREEVEVTLLDETDQYSIKRIHLPPGKSLVFGQGYKLALYLLEGDSIMINSQTMKLLETVYLNSDATNTVGNCGKTLAKIIAIFHQDEG